MVFPHRLRARGLANHQPMGVERGSSNLGIASIQLPCARPNSLLRRLRLILSLDHPNQHTFPTDLRSGHANHTPQALPEPNSLYKLMERCAGKLGTPSMHKNVDRSAMAQCGCCMPRGSAIVARVSSVSSVKNQRRPSKRDESVRFFGRSLPLRHPLHRPSRIFHQQILLLGVQRFLLHSQRPDASQEKRLLLPSLVLYSGEIGSAARSGGDG